MKLNLFNQEDELRSTIKSISNILTSFKAGIAIKYIENISYLSHLTNIDKIVEFGYLSIVFGLLLLEFHDSLKISTEENTHLFDSCKKLHSILQKTHKFSKLSKLAPKKIQNETQKIFYNCKSQVSTHNPLYPQTVAYKINLFSSIISSSKSTPLQLSLSAFLNTFEQQLTSTIFPKFTNRSYPYLPVYDHKSLTLVLDLDETLVHKKDSEFLIRPGTFEFLESLKLKFEVVIFTAASAMHADSALRIIDPLGEIKLRLYKDHASRNANCCIKDLEMLGRDIDKVIIVDNMPENFGNLKANGIAIETWIGDLGDDRLFSLKVELEKVCETSGDVREAISALPNFCN